MSAPRSLPIPDSLFLLPSKNPEDRVEKGKRNREEGIRKNPERICIRDFWNIETL